MPVQLRVRRYECLKDAKQKEKTKNGMPTLGSAYPDSSAIRKCHAAGWAIERMYINKRSVELKISKNIKIGISIHEKAHA